MKQEVKIGQADYTVLILIRDSSTGAPKTALTYESAGIDICYVRVETDNDVVLTDGAPVTTTLTGAHVDWGFVLVDDAKCPGLYKLDIADGVFVSGAWSAVVSFICTGCDPVHIEFALVPESPVDGVKVNSIAGNAITATAINADAITSAKIADDAISAEHINTGAITADAFAADSIVAATLKADAVTKIADGILTRDWTSVTGEAARSVLNALRFLRNKWTLAGTTLSVKKENDSTEAWTAEVTTSASADPITGSDPA